MKTVHIDNITPYARNSRTHSESQIKKIAASLETFGMVGAIVVRNGVIAKGHGTLSAIKQIYASGGRLYPAPGAASKAKPYPAQHVPVLDVSGWTDAQFRAFVIADNRLAEKAGWDVEILIDEINDLDLDGFDVEVVGFDDNELDQLDAQFTGADDELPLDANQSGQRDSVPEPNEKPSGKAQPIRVPIVIELSPAQNAKWRELKKSAGLNDNAAAFLHFTGIDGQSKEESTS